MKFFFLTMRKVPRFKMNSRVDNRATFVEVFNSIKFSGKRRAATAHPWPTPGFAVNKSTHTSANVTDDEKLVRSSN
jgi:hypothetical protein